MENITSDITDIFQILYELPITKQPWQNPDTLKAANKYRNDGIIREFSGILNAHKLGYRTTLIACKVSTEEIETTANIISKHPGVSHNYLRDGSDYNIWFTFAANKNNFSARLKQLIANTNISEYLELDCIKKYKLSLKCAFLPNETHSQNDNINNDYEENSKNICSTKINIKKLSRSQQELLISAIRILQNEFPIIERPFRKLATLSNGIFDEASLIKYAEMLKQSGILRRIGALWNHKKLGLKYNTLCLWQLPSSQTDKFANFASSFNNITHCYRRKSYPCWKWQIYTMIHGTNRQQCNRTIDQLLQEFPNAKLLMLPTLKEYKKERIKYIPEFDF